MAVNEGLYKRLVDAGFAHYAAIILADPENDSFLGGAFTRIIVIENGASVPADTPVGTVIFEKA